MDKPPYAPVTGESPSTERTRPGLPHDPANGFMEQAIRESAQRRKQGLPCWCEGISGHAGWLVCAEFRAGVLAAAEITPARVASRASDDSAPYNSDKRVDSV